MRIGIRLDDLPGSIRARAFEASNGELAWRREDIDEAIMAIRDARLAILGGEIWRVVGPGSWDGIIPGRNGGMTGIHGWDTAARSLSESWIEYCERTADESLNVIPLIRLDLESEVSTELLEDLRFNVTCIPEEGKR